MRQHRVADDIADGVNALGRCAKPGIDLDKPTVVHFDSSLFEIQVGGVRPAPDRHEHLLESLGLGRVLPIKDQLRRAFHLFQADDSGFQADLLEIVFQSLEQRANQIPIHAGHQLRQHFDDRHLGTEGGIDLTQLQPDVSAADHQQRLGNLFQLQRRP